MTLEIKSFWHLPFIFVELKTWNKHLREAIKCFAWIFSLMTALWNIIFLVWGNMYRKFVTCTGYKIRVNKNAGNSLIVLSLYTFVVHFTCSSDNRCYRCFWVTCKLLWFSQHNFIYFCPVKCCTFIFWTEIEIEG